MKWSWRIAKVAGIGIYVHVTFALLLMFAGWRGFLPNQSWWEALQSIAFVLVLFVIVVLHELGHALMARRFGIGTKDITLLPIGGVARLERMPEEPKKELAVALAGPAVNVVLAIIFGAILLFQASLSSWRQVLEQGGFVAAMVAVNVFLVIFNMLPAFPMDGGRVLRALLALKLNYARATAIAARIGQGMALVLGLAGLMGWIGGEMNPFLVLIALFVWMGAAQESSMVQLKSALGGTRVRQIMITDYRTLAPEDTLSQAVEFLLSGYQDDFPVVREGRVVGLLTRGALMEGLSKLGAESAVGTAMRHTFPAAAPDDLAESVFVRFQTSSCRSIPVIQEGYLIGIITAENVGEYLMVQSALHHEPAAHEMGRRLSERHAG